MKTITIAGKQVNALTIDDAAHISPDVAREWIEQDNGNYRKVSNVQVRNFTKLMEDGHWYFNGDSICMNPDGKNKDGQHRLTSAANANFTLPAFLIDIDRDENIDLKKKLSFNSILHSMGYKNPNPLGAAIKLVYLNDIGCENMFRDNRSVDNITLKRYFDKNMDIIDSFNDTAKYYAKSGIPHSKLAAFYHIAKRKDAKLAIEFVKLLGTDIEDFAPEQRNKWSALYQLKQIFGNATEQSSLKIDYRVALVIKSWNYWRKDEPCTKLIWRVNGAHPEAFPIIE